MVERRRSKRDYQVGYRKPPKHSRFKPGQSGNPKGRPKGTRNFRTDVKQTLSHPVRLTQDGGQRKISTQAAVLLRLREQALKGDIRALNRLIGLAAQYNDEGLGIEQTQSSDDKALIDVFLKRSASGALYASNRDPEPKTSAPAEKPDGSVTRRRLERRRLRED